MQFAEQIGHMILSSQVIKMIRRKKTYRIIIISTMYNDRYIFDANLYIMMVLLRAFVFIVMIWMIRVYTL